MSGFSANWMEGSTQAAFLGTYDDGTGSKAAYFLSWPDGKLIGPLDLELAKADPQWEVAAPSVGKMDSLPLGTLGTLKYYYIADAPSMPGEDTVFPGLRGTFQKFELNSSGAKKVLEIEEIISTNHDALLRGVLNVEYKKYDSQGYLKWLQEIKNVNEAISAIEGLRIGRNMNDAMNLAGRFLLTPEKTWNAKLDVKGLYPLLLLDFEGLKGLGKLAPMLSKLNDPDAPLSVPLVEMSKTVHLWQTSGSTTKKSAKHPSKTELQKSFLGIQISGVALFRKTRHMEASVAPLHGPFLTLGNGDISMEFLKRRSADFYAALEGALSENVSYPECYVLKATAKYISAVVVRPGPVIYSFTGPLVAKKKYVRGEKLQIFAHNQGPEEKLLQIRSLGIHLDELSKVLKDNPNLEKVD